MNGFGDFGSLLDQVFFMVWRIILYDVYDPSTLVHCRTQALDFLSE